MTLITHAFQSAARMSPGKRAIWCEGTSMTYEELANLVSRCSLLMVRRGVRRGEHVGVLLPNGVEFVVLMLTAARLGVVLVPLNSSLPPPAVARAFRAADVKHVVGSSDALEALTSSRLGEFSFVDGVWLEIGGERASMGFPGSLPEAPPRGGAADLGARDDDPFILTMTSGATGDPKPIVLTQRVKFERARAAADLYGVSAEDRVLAATPLYHSLAERLVLIPMLTRGTSILMAKFSPSAWLSCVRDQRVTFTIAVSTQLRQISEALTAGGSQSIDSLRCIVSSSALLEGAVKRRLIEALGCRFHECYGTSEIAIASDLDADGAKTRPKSVGKAIAGVDIKILGDNDQVVEPGAAGEIVCSSPMMFAGYHKRADMTRDAMWGRYFRTGDLGKLDKDGYLYFLGRKKDIIITGGINVYPADVELTLMEHSSVAECAAFPLRDDRLGEIVAVAVVPRDARSFDQRALRIHCGRTLADFQQPRRVFVVNQLPKNSIGKTMKQALVARFAGT
ncbi:MAG: class I adenylate-forming enzyme family protein [Verrucomicrobiota bacterium]|nr:class I adenylate-forming enzyme family protein [Verrucomicrobiota bacterium]